MGGVAWALISAVALGTNSIVVAVTARRIGVLLTTGVSIVIAFLLLIAYALVMQLRFVLDGGDWVLLALLAAAAAVAFLASYRSLQLGPLAVVSPISASNGLMTVLFAFAFVGERPTMLQWCGIPVAAAGSVLASVRAEGNSRLSLVGAGPLFAALGVASGAISNAGLRIPIRHVGAVQTILVQRAFTVLYVWAVLLLIFRRGRAGGHPQRPKLKLSPHNAALLGVVGLLDAFSFLTFAKGLAVSPAWLVGILSQSGRVIAVLGGIVLFREHLRGYQWFGIGLLAVGLALSVL